MESSVFLTRVVLRNYRSIASCDVNLGSLTYLVGANGSGKSNFIDALHLVRDALIFSLDSALNDRGGLNEVRRRSSGHPNHFGVRLEFQLDDARRGHYAFNVGAISGGGFEVLTEECSLGGPGKGPFYKVDHGKLKSTSEDSFPSITSDRLALVSASGMTAFRPVYDALTSMGFYNFNPKLMRELQKPSDGRLLKGAGENIASVLNHLQRNNQGAMDIIKDYLHVVVPMVHGVQRIPVSHMETIEFKQEMAGAKSPWKFNAINMSDGTLRALAVLTALFQNNIDFSPNLIAIEEPETALHPAASGALREALQRASRHNQVIVTSHSPDLLDDETVLPESLLVVTGVAGETKISRLSYASRSVVEQQMFSVGELLRLNQLSPDHEVSSSQEFAQPDLFGDIKA